MNNKKARKLRRIAKKEMEGHKPENERMVYQDLKTMYKNKDISLR